MPTGLLYKGSLFPQHKVRKITLLFLFIFCFFSIVFATGGNCAQVTLAWDANSEPNIAGYKVYYGTASRVYNWYFDVGKVTTYSVTGLTDGSTYFFAATAYDTSGVESTYSSEVSYNGCTYSISPTTAQPAQQGGTGTVQVSTQAGCRWTASSGASWFTITSGSQGTGNGTVAYSVSSNSSTSSRTVASTIAGKVFTVTQAGSGSTSYTITASAGSNGSISPTGAVSVASGASRAFTITPATGYRVASVLVDGASVGAVTSYTFSNVTANHTISASFTANTTSYTITASAGSNGSISPTGAVSVASGASRAFTITPATGYRVASVLVDGASVGAVTSYTFSNVTANHTISASFTANTTSYTITASAGSNGSISPTGAVSVASGASRAFTITPATGYRVASVLVDGASVGAVTSYTFSNVTANHTISASFTANDTTATVKYKLKTAKTKKNSGDGVITSSDSNINCGDVCSNTYAKDTLVTLSASPNFGSTFTGWVSSSANCTGTGSCTVKIDKAKTIKAVFVGDYQLKIVNISKHGGSGRVRSSPSGIRCVTNSTTTCEASYSHGDQVTLSARPDSGSTFLGWQPASKCPGTGSCDVHIDKNYTVKAIFSGPE